MANDEVPTIDEFRPIVLKMLWDGQIRSMQEIVTMVADIADLSEHAREQKISSGQFRFANRIQWACSALFHAGLLTRPKRAWYQITDDGKTVAERGLQSYSERDMFEWPKWTAYKQEVAARKQRRDGLENTQVELEVRANEIDDEESDPIEKLEVIEREANFQIETELRQRLQQASPEFFEKAVIELLWAMGYGGDRGEKRHVGRSNDGGIDGVIRQDALGLSNVYIQAKRYADGNNVGRPAIQQFYGALASKNADRGVFITTSGFSVGAKTEAASYKGKTIVLIDGLKLTELMRSYGVAVGKRKEFTLYEVDDDFFEL